MLKIISGREERAKDKFWDELRRIEKQLLSANPLSIPVDFGEAVYIALAYSMLPANPDGSPHIVHVDEVRDEVVSRVRALVGGSPKSDVSHALLGILERVMSLSMVEIGRRVLLERAACARAEDAEKRLREAVSQRESLAKQLDPASREVSNDGKEIKP